MSGACGRRVSVESGSSMAEAASPAVVVRPPMDSYELEDRYEVRLDVPGSGPERIEVLVEEGVLLIRASVPDRGPNGGAVVRSEHRTAGYGRRIRLGEDVDPEGITASCDAGVLTVRLPKRARHLPRRIEVSGV